MRPINSSFATFSKMFFRLHMNIHYLERPFRCDTCSVSFRTKGHLQKHERSASHYSKVSHNLNCITFDYSFNESQACRFRLSNYYVKVENLAKLHALDIRFVASRKTDHIYWLRSGTHNTCIINR